MSVEFRGDELFYSSNYAELKLRIRQASSPHGAINFSRLVDIILSIGWEVCTGYPKTLNRGGYKFKLGDGEHYFKCRIYPHRSAHHLLEVDEFGHIQRGLSIKLSGPRGRT